MGCVINLSLNVNIFKDMKYIIENADFTIYVE